MQSLWMLAASFLFACMGVCVKFAAESHSAVEITFYRAFISLILMFGLVRLQGVALATPHWRWQITRGLVGFIATYRGYTATPTSAGVSAATTGTVVVGSVTVLLFDYVITALWGV